MNLLLSTDVYKVSHGDQYPKGTTKVYSYLCARKGFSQEESKVIFFGLKYYLEKYLAKGISHEDIDEFIKVYSKIAPLTKETIDRMCYVADLGYLPIRVKALPEFEEYHTFTPLLTITNTDPNAYWLVNYIEGLMLKLWYPCSVATKSKKYFNIAKSYTGETCDDGEHLPYAVHDFGYRSVSSEESSMLGGAAHLVNFKGSDNILGEYMLNKYYQLEGAKSVPASEHSVMCSHGKEDEFKSFERMLDLYPTGIVSIVSDTYDLWNVLENFTDRLSDRILKREGKVVFRPDSGLPEDIICGNPYSYDPSEVKGALNILWDKFGGRVNKKGYKILNPKVGLIYGEGITLERYERILLRMKNMGFASSNLTIGVGGLMLQNNSRDDYGFAQKTTYIEVNGEPRNVFKDPITDRKKKSHKGLLSVEESHISGIHTLDVTEECSWEKEKEGLLKTVFLDGKLC
ncbi:nicotinate phosphoribosyltransferase [Cognatishimia sp.]|uniref:nicotinate phosphoribosyltransferase n=1 Tax=Cognatishimia sp. TaxID=2211648 RepID=UPI003519C1A3|nr:nicotinate phosphoribosyltransferase [Cognatishimia sp.]